MSVTPISMAQVQGILQQSKRRTGATTRNNAAQNSGMSRFEALLREPQQVADAMASSQSSQSSAVSTQHPYFGLTGAEQASRSGMNLSNVSALATLINVASVEPTVLSNALKTLTDAAERNQLETASASGAAARMQGIQGMMSREIERGDMNAVIEATSGSTSDEAKNDDATHVESIASSEIRGSLAAMFESGAGGDISAVGYDSTGGTSYGKYQFSSARGAMDDFLTYLDTHASDISLHLRAAGDINTGSKQGEMPTAWKEVAKIDPVRFEKMQDAFTHSRYYSPVARVVQDKMNIGQMSPAMEEVLLSTSLQHGPRGAVQIFAKAFGATGGFSGDMQEAFIRNVYTQRNNEFTTSTPNVRAGVQNRLSAELNAALSMLA